MKVAVVLELELTADQLSEEALDTWMWSLERQVEELELVETASVALTFPRPEGKEASHG